MILTHDEAPLLKSLAAQDARCALLPDKPKIRPCTKMQGRIEIRGTTLVDGPFQTAPSAGIQPAAL